MSSFGKLESELFRRFFSCTRELIVLIGGRSGQYKECITDASNSSCFVLIFNFDNNNSSLFDARERCTRIGWRLAEIRSNEIQNATDQFLRSAEFFIRNVSQRNVIVNAMRHNEDAWHWVNGNEADNNTFTVLQSVNQTVDQMGVLKLVNSSIVFNSTSATSNSTGYICEYQNTTVPFPDSNCTFQHDDRCFVFKNMTLQTWYSARTICLANNGDLASLEFIGNNFSLVDSVNISQWFDSKTSYWIGLRKSWWIWEGSGNEVNYTYWKSGVPLNNLALNCICLSYDSSSVGQWINCDCNASAQLHSLCIPAQATMSTPSTSVAVPTDAYDLINSRNSVAIGLGVGLGLLVLLLVIAVVILVVLIIRRRLLTEDITSSQSSLTIGEQTKSKRRNESSLYAQVDEPYLVSPSSSSPTADSIMSQSCYATVRQCDAKSMPADANLPEKQTVYADFDIRSE